MLIEHVDITAGQKVLVDVHVLMLLYSRTLVPISQVLNDKHIFESVGFAFALNRNDLHPT